MRRVLTSLNDATSVLVLYVAPLPFFLAVFARATQTFWTSPAFQRSVADGTTPNQALILTSALAVALGCALPAVLMIAIKLLVTESLRARQCLFEPRGGEPSLQEKDALQFWEREMEQFDERTSRMVRHMRIYSFTATMVLSTCALLLLPTFRAPATPIGNAAVAAGSAGMVTFVVDVGRMVVRSARRDASARMFAWATRRFLLVEIASVLLSCLILVQSQSLPANKATWILIGAGLAFLGDRAVFAVGERVADALKIGRPSPEQGSDLPRIDGLSEETAARLGEEGISSLHALAFCSTPRLFLTTPYPLTEICDWQDQALLHVRLGSGRARLCREQLMVRGATDLMALAHDLHAGKLAENDIDDMGKLLGLPSRVQTEAMMRRAKSDPVAARLAVYRRAITMRSDAARQGGV